MPPQKVQELRPREAGKLQEDLRPVRVAAVGAPAGATKSAAMRGHRQKVHLQEVQELPRCEAGKLQEDLRPVRSVAASAAASQGRLRRLRRQHEVQDQEEEMQQEAAEDYEEVQEALREGPQEEEAAVPEDLLRARLRGVIIIIGKH